MNLKTFINRYLTYNKRELNGTIILLLITTLTIGIAIYTKNYSPVQINDYSQFRKEILELEQKERLANVNNKFTEESYSSVNNQSQSKSDINCSYQFNPNNLSLVDWLKIGLTQKQAKTISNYISKGGKFYKAEDLKKIWGISEEEYQQLAEYISIPNSNNINNSKTFINRSPNKGIEPIELNNADSGQLIKIKGIGPAFAQRIIKYKKLLGGFYRKEQLLEVWGLDTMRYNSIRSFVKVDSSLITKININTIDFKTLNSHPYIDYNQTKAILNYRKTAGLYRRIQDIQNAPGINKSVYEKIRAYITTKD